MHTVNVCGFAVDKVKGLLANVWASSLHLVALSSWNICYLHHCWNDGVMKASLSWGRWRDSWYGVWSLLFSSPFIVFLLHIQEFEIMLAHYKPRCRRKGNHHEYVDESRHLHYRFLMNPSISQEASDGSRPFQMQCILHASLRSPKENAFSISPWNCRSGMFYFARECEKNAPTLSADECMSSEDYYEHQR